MATGLFNLKQVNQAISQGAWSGYIAPKWVEYLVVAGGGAGSGYTGGGGGAGGLLTGIVTVAAGTSYTVTVGSGGAGNSSGIGASGQNSVFGSISSTGGGGGNGANAAPGSSAYSGGSGGGAWSASLPQTYGQGIAGQGNSGNNGLNSGGGGGGAGTIGLAGVTSGVGANGGAGIASAITGTVVTYAGGGGGGGNAGGAGGSGGVGGGGGGGSLNAASGSSNTGGGGGGAGYNGGAGTSGSGGSGIVVVRYPGNVQFFTGGTVNYNNGYIIHIFTSSGTLAPTTPTPYNTSYQISRSLRFNSADSAYLNRTPASATNRRTWTWSAWVKRSALGTVQELFDGYWANTDNGYFWVGFTSADAFEVQLYNSTLRTTTQVFRDPSAWYHFVLAVDTTQATAANRVKVYLNGSEITTFSTNNAPTQNLDTAVNYNGAHYIGTFSGTTNLFNGYQTEINLIDGQALTPSSFGATSTTNGVWAPIQYTGSYGTNGFYLNFSDNSNTTAATLGKDYSGNGNNWTPNNFSVTAGAGNDSLVDSPTSYGTDTGVGGTVRGNYATLNPLKKKSTATISNGNLALVATSAVYVTGLSTISPSSGTYYMEMLCSGSNSNRPWAIGVVNANASADASMSDTGTYFVTNNSGSTVNYYLGGSPTALSTSSTWVAGDIISLAWNVDSGKFWVGRNGVWYPSSTGGTVASNADVAAGNYPTFTISYSGNTNPQVIPAFVTYDTTASIDANFGQRPFAYTAPSGYKALCTQNLPTPTIGATSNTLATQFFNPVLWTGTSANPRTITGVGFQPDLVWVKKRSAAGNNFLQDAVRGVTSTDSRSLVSNNTDVETNYYTTNGGVTAFASDGFTTSGGSTNLNLNESGVTYIAWNWKANGAGATNTAGTVTSTVSANTTSGFSVVTWTGSSAGQTVGHGLGVAPSLIIAKTRNNAGENWPVYHKNLGVGQYLFLSSTAAANSTYPTYWGSSAPTAIVFGTFTGGYPSANNYGNMVAYCFAPVAGFSAFGSYTGNNSTDGPFVFTGFRVGWVMIKCTGGGTSWIIYDAVRNTYNATTNDLIANSTNAEATSYSIDLLSNGFKIRSLTSNLNDSSTTYVYAAFASNPFKTSLAR